MMETYVIPFLVLACGISTLTWAVMASLSGVCLDLWIEKNIANPKELPSRFYTIDDILNSSWWILILLGDILIGVCGGHGNLGLYVCLFLFVLLILSAILVYLFNKAIDGYLDKYREHVIEAFIEKMS